MALIKYHAKDKLDTAGFLHWNHSWLVCDFCKRCIGRVDYNELLTNSRRFQHRIIISVKTIIDDKHRRFCKRLTCKQEYQDLYGKT